MCLSPLDIYTLKLRKIRSIKLHERDVLQYPNNASRFLPIPILCFDRVTGKSPLQDGTGETTALVVTALDALCLGARSLGRLEDGLGNGGSGATRAVSVDERGGATSHVGSALMLTVGHWGRVGVDLQVDQH